MTVSTRKRTEAQLQQRRERTSGLCLERKVGQQIHFTLANGERISVLVRQTRGGRVRLNCVAPDSVRITRPDKHRAPESTTAA